MNSLIFITGLVSLLCSNKKDMTNLEIWKDIPKYSPYQASSWGRVRTKSRKVRNSKKGYRIVEAKNLVLWDNGHGYKVLGTQINNKKKNFYIHRLVAELFIPNPKNLPEVNHKDGDKSNNHYSNLEWVTTKENRDHAVKIDLVAHGERNHNAKLTEQQVIETLEYFNSNPKALRIDYAKKLGVADTVVCRILSGKRWRRVWENYHITRFNKLPI